MTSYFRERTKGSGKPMESLESAEACLSSKIIDSATSIGSAMSGAKESAVTRYE